MSTGAGPNKPLAEDANLEGAEATLNALAEAIQQLSPAQRRRLLRRLRTAGLLDSDELLTDRGRLQVAPALGLLAQRRSRRASQKPRGAGAVLIPANPPHEDHPVPTQSEPYRSAVSGKVVKGAPRTEAPLEPHGMAALPGQAPEQPIVVIFDGGSRGNPGQGYGSYALRWPGQAQQIVQLRFGDRVTNNEAEYDTLIAALEAILQRLQDAQAAPSTAKVEIRGDSLLVINQVKGLWEAKEPRLQVRRDRARSLLEPFGAWQLIHHDREHSVQTLGH
ncbi:MAG: ribonuclease HI family protein [Caldilineaceae bacterium]|nr:ribonuclease HI family protein [Caldilineaceae bacterium]